MNSGNPVIIHQKLWDQVPNKDVQAKKNRFCGFRNVRQLFAAIHPSSPEISCYISLYRYPKIRHPFLVVYPDRDLQTNGIKKYLHCLNELPSKHPMQNEKLKCSSKWVSHTHTRSQLQLFISETIVCLKQNSCTWHPNIRYSRQKCFFFKSKVSLQHILQPGVTSPSNI